MKSNIHRSLLFTPLHYTHMGHPMSLRFIFTAHTETHIQCSTRTGQTLTLTELYHLLLHQYQTMATASHKIASSCITAPSNLHLQDSYITPPKSLDSYPLKHAITPSHSANTSHYGHTKSYTEELMDNDLTILPLGCPPSSGPVEPLSQVGSNWKSFSTHFTQEFELL